FYSERVAEHRSPIDSELRIVIQLDLNNLRFNYDLTVNRSLDSFEKQAHCIEVLRQIRCKHQAGHSVEYKFAVRRLQRIETCFYIGKKVCRFGSRDRCRRTAATAACHCSNCTRSR